MIVATSGIPTYFNWTSVTAPQDGLSVKKQLSPAEQDQVKQLKALDKQVRDHEQEHLRAGGALVRSGGAIFEYTMGPDGRLYAARGGVEVDSDPVKGDPQGTIDKAAKLHKTALAAGLDASLQDNTVAATANHMANRAYAQEEATQAQQTRLTQARMAYTLHNSSTPSTLTLQA